MGELFMPCEMPEPPKEGFFKGLFGGGVRPLDREELCMYFAKSILHFHFCIPLPPIQVHQSFSSFGFISFPFLFTSKLANRRAKLAGALLVTSLDLQPTWRI